MKRKPLSREQKAHLSRKQKERWTPEARAAASAKAKASASIPSSGSGKSSVPPALPPSVSSESSPGSAETLLQSLLTKVKAMGTKETEEETKPKTPELPDDPDDREAALRPARYPARVPIMGTNELFKVLGLAELSEEERAEGIEAFSVLFFQWGLYRDGRVLVALWVLGVMIPRATSAALLWRQRKALQGSDTLPPGGAA